MEQNLIIGGIAGLSCFIAFLGFEHTKAKDQQSITTSIAVLMTKVDTLTSIKEKVDRHDEIIVRHEEKIHNIEDTLRFGKIRMEDIKNNE